VLRNPLTLALAVGLVVAIAPSHVRAEETRATRTKNPTLVASGAGVILFGVAAGVAGGFTTLFAAECRECINPNQGVMAGLAGAVDLIALGGIGAGIAMVTIGARRVPIDSAADGGTCSVTSDCTDGRHCIDGRCRSLLPQTAESQAPDASKPTTVSGAVMLGDGRGYVVAAVVTDLCAFLTTIPPWMASYAGDPSRFLVGIQLAPFFQLAAGPTLHLFKGRVGPSLISLLGWTTVAMTTFFVPTAVSPNGDRPNGLAAGTAMLATGGIAMTLVDAFMARPAPKRVIDRPETITWSPMLRPLNGGAMTGIAGTW
jgi:hypothetical protein